MALQDMFTGDYWLAGITTPTDIVSRDSASFWFYIIFFFAVSAAGVLLMYKKQMMPIDHPLSERMGRWSSVALTMGCLGSFWFLCRELNIAYIGTRIWMVVAALFLVYFLFIEKKYYKDFLKLQLEGYNKSSK